MKFPFDYVALSAIPAFCVGVCAGAMITAALATRWLRRHGLGRLAGDDENDDHCGQKEVEA